MTLPSSGPSDTRRTSARSWTLAGLGLFLAGWFASLLAIALLEQVVLVPLGLRSEAGEVSLSIRNGLHQIAWGAAVAALSIPIGRRLVPGIAFGRAGAVVLVVGLVLAAVVELLIVEFGRVREGYFSVRHAGISIAAPPAIVGVSLAAWAAMAIPRPDRRALVALAVAAAVGFGLALAPSLNGLSDGIDPDSIPLAASLMASAGFVVIAPVVAALRHAELRREPPVTGVGS